MRQQGAGQPSRRPFDSPTPLLRLIHASFGIGITSIDCVVCKKTTPVFLSFFAEYDGMFPTFLSETEGTSRLALIINLVDCFISIR